VTFEIQTSRSSAIAERVQRVMPGGDTRSVTFYTPFPLALVRGEGHRVWDADGNEFIDVLNNYTALVHGHAAPAIVRAIQDQAPQGTVFPAPSELQAEVAERICERVASVERVRFTNSGSEAVLQAIRIARAVTGRDDIVKADGGYHGSWEQVPMSLAQPHGHVAEDDRAAPVARGTGIPRAVQDLVHMVRYNDVASLEATMREQGGRIAALIFEPVLGEGVIPGDPTFFAAARRLADEHGALLVLDEVVTARLAWGGHQSVLGVEPDLTTFGKVIGGGLPVGAVGGRHEIMAAFDPRRRGYVSHSGTFNGNPMTMAAGRASLDLLTAGEIDRINAMGERLAEGLRRGFRSAGVDGGVTAYGSFLHLHFDSPASIRSFDDVNLASPGLARMHRACLNEGVYLAPRGMLNLSTAMDDGVVDELVERMTRAAARVAQTDAVSTAAT
jgi:glutamate-1-semialdehyde 2,1-aminomutase